MTWQGPIVAAIVCACAVYLARRWYRMLAGKGEGHCGCGECPGQHRSISPAPNPKSETQSTK